MALTALALDNADLLRRLRAPEAIASKTALADDLGRDRSNLNKTLARLAAEGLVDAEALTLTTAGQDALDAIARAEGRAVLPPEAATARGPAGAARAPIAAFTPDPNQPRKTFDPSALLDLARAIASAGDILEPLVVRPPDASGARMIVAGERRWRAAALLANFTVPDCVLPAALDPLTGGGLPYVERAPAEQPAGGGDGDVAGAGAGAGAAEAAEADTLFLALIENGAREDLDPLEDGAAVLRLMTLRGWSARQAAHELGRVGQVDGQPGAGAKGIKTLQERVKVAREATDEARAAYRAGGTWKDLLASVQEKQLDQAWAAEREVRFRRGIEGLAGRRRLALLEMIHKAVMEPLDESGRRVAIGSREADAHGTVTALVMHAGGVFGGDDASISDVAMAWVEEQGLLDRADPHRTLKAARLEVLAPSRIEALERARRWETPWLNLTHDPDDPRVYNGEFYANATMAAEARRRAEGKGGASSPSRPRDPAEEPGAPIDPPPTLKPLTGAETLVLAELYMAAGRPKADDDHWHIEGHAPVGKYWLDETVSTLKAGDRVTILHRAGDVPRMALTRAGMLAMADAMMGVVDNLVANDWSTLVDLRRALGVSVPDRIGFVTPWLNPEPALPPTLADIPPGPAGVDIERADGDPDADDRTVEDILGVALVEIAAERSVTDAADFLARLLSRTGVTPPFVVGREDRGEDPAMIYDATGGALLTVDVDRDQPDAVAASQAILVAACLNAALGLTVDFGAPDAGEPPAVAPVPASEPEGETA